MSVPTPRADLPLARWLDALAAIGEAVGGDEPVTELSERVARTACTLLGYDFCGVFLPDASGQALSIVGSHGLLTDYIAEVNASRPILLDVRGADEAPTSIAYRTGEVVTLEDIALHPGFAWGGVADEQGYRALVSVPLRRGRTVVGAINGYHANPHRFDAAEIGLVTTLATQVAIALGTAQLRAREQDTIRELRRAEEVHTLLTATALRGEGVAGVAAALAELLQRAVRIDDIYDETLALVGWPVESWHPDDLRPFPVVLDGDEVARIHVQAERDELSRLDMRAIEHAAVVTALELLRARTAAEVEQRLRGSLVAELLSSDGTDIDGLLGRARRLGWDLSGTQVLFAVRCVEADKAGGRPISERLLAAVDRYVTGVSPRPLSAIHRGDLILVWPHDAAGTGVETEIADIADIAAGLVDLLASEAVIESARSAVAPPTAVRELPGVFRTLRGALDLAEGGNAPAVIDLREIAIDHLLLKLDDPAELRGFARAVLGPALDYDRQRSTELLRTARVLLEHDLDRRAAASVLHLHPNTVQQRTRRLEELTGLRLARPRDLLRLTASLTVAQIAGMG